MARTRKQRSNKLNKKWVTKHAEQYKRQHPDTDKIRIEDLISRITKGSHLSINAGPRYVFFNSLRGRTGYYQIPLQLGESLVSSAQSALMAGQQGIEYDPDQLTKIQNYVNMIGEAAKRQLSLESSFLTKMMSKVTDESVKKIIQENKDKIDPTNNQFDYKSFIVVLNSVATKIDDFTKKRRQILISNAKLIEENIKERERNGDNIREQLNEAMQQGYRQFQTKLDQEELLQKRQIEGQLIQFDSGVHETIAQKISSMIYQISNSQEIINVLSALIINNFGSNISPTEIAQQLKAAVVNYIFSLDINDVLEKPSKELREGFQAQMLTNNRIYNSNELERLSNLTTKKAIKSIQQQALITKKDVGALFSSFTAQTQDEIIKKYGISQQQNDKIKKLLDELNDTSKTQVEYASAKGQLTKILKQAIFKQYQQFQTMAIEDRRERFKQLQEKNEDFITESHLRTSVANALKVKFQSSSVSQEIEARLIEKISSLIASGHVRVMGNIIRMRTDIGLTYQLGSLKGIADPKATNNIIKELSQFTEKFVTRYSKKTGNQINVDIGMQQYIEQQKDLVKKIQQQAQKTGGDTQEAIQSLQNFFTTEISQKEYTKGGNFGFEGGSLGGGGAPEAVINNIYKMYETGGISPIDKNILYFAAINCSQAALGAQLKIPLQEYLLGAAALMMFDSGFTATTGFLEQMKSQLGFEGHGSLHLFSLQGGNLIPASYLYTSIYNSLLAAYGGIVQELEKPPSKTAQAGSRVTVSNSLSDADIPDYTIMPLPQQRWDYISEIAQSQVNISFTFLAGMLDIFEAIQEAFNI